MTRLFDKLRAAPAVLFVCSGNVVRSAFAELYARHLGLDLPIHSAATTYRNPALFPETHAALRERRVAPGLVASFRPRHLEDVVPGLPAGTLAFGMTRSHLADLAVWPGAPVDAHLMLEVLGEERELADPVMDGVDFGATYRTLERCVTILVRERRGP